MTSLVRAPGVQRTRKESERYRDANEHQKEACRLQKLDPVLVSLLREEPWHEQRDGHEFAPCAIGVVPVHRLEHVDGHVSPRDGSGDPKHYEGTDQPIRRHIGQCHLTFRFCRAVGSAQR